uniref:5-hydroxytryptamine receptor 7 n=1 Tax=Eptatretus burgeri TaxID=7764 RepID=A0A8C4Q7C7_EPTBU
MVLVLNTSRDPFEVLNGSTPTPAPNNSSGGRCAEPVLMYGTGGKLIIGLVLTTMTVLTIAGNLLVILSVCVVKKLRQPSNYLLVSLAAADLSVALAVMPFMLVTDLMGGEWMFGQAFCNVFIAMDVTCCTASILSLCVISVDRYLSITKPLTYPARQNGHLMAKMVLGVWLLSASITLPPFFGWANNVLGDHICLISQDLGYTVYSTAVAFYLPTTVMLIMYYRIYRAARISAARHSFQLSSTVAPRSSPRPHCRAPRGDVPSDASNGNGEENRLGACIMVNGNPKKRIQREAEHCSTFSKLLRHEGHNISIFKREQKAARTLGVIVGGFTLCWLPFFILSTLRPFVCEPRCSCIPPSLERTFLWFGYANSLINPLIYAFFNRDLRTAFRNVLRCRYRNINRRLSAEGMQEALKVAERPHHLV